MRVGLVIAVEIKAFIRGFQGEYQKINLNGFDIYLVKSELAEIFA